MQNKPVSLSFLNPCICYYIICVTSFPSFNGMRDWPHFTAKHNFAKDNNYNNKKVFIKCKILSIALDYPNWPKHTHTHTCTRVQAPAHTSILTIQLQSLIYTLTQLRDSRWLQTASQNRKHTHTHTGTSTHKHSDYTKLNLHSLETWGGWRQHHRTKTWQVYSFGSKTTQKTPAFKNIWTCLFFSVVGMIVLNKFHPLALSRLTIGCLLKKVHKPARNLPVPAKVWDLTRHQWKMLTAMQGSTLRVLKVMLLMLIQ